jgi:FkbM family methyltransferase
MIESLIKKLPNNLDWHKRESTRYNYYYNQLKQYIDTMKQECHFTINDKSINIPYFKMGNCDSTNLFDLDEIILFSFYWHNRNRYKNVLDIGANIGLHSIVMNRCGFNVTAYEPDQMHRTELIQNLIKNNCENEVALINKAVSDYNGTGDFVRILDNTTGSHLANSKDNVYGPIETVTVNTVDINDIIDDIDLIKIDAEGHEDTILRNIDLDKCKYIDIILEVGSRKSAKIIFEKFKDFNVCSQKIGWRQIQCLEDIPISYKEGSLFISYNNTFYENIILFHNSQLNLQDRCEFVINLPNNIKVAAEIGVEEGVFSEMILKHNYQITLYSIDAWGPCDWYKDSKSTNKKYWYNYFVKTKKRLAKFGNRSQIIKQQSNEAYKNFDDNFFDFIYIDANHGYNYISEDINNWFPKLKVGGIFAGHDYCNKFCPGVVQAVDEFILNCHSNLYIIPIGHECLDHNIGVTNSSPSWMIIKNGN